MAGGWSAILFITNRLRETTTTTTWHQQARLCFASSNLWSIVIWVAFNLPPNGSSGPGIPSQWEFLSIGAFVMLLDVMLLLYFYLFLPRILFAGGCPINRSEYHSHRNGLRFVLLWRSR